MGSLNAPTGAWCSLTIPGCGTPLRPSMSLNAPTGAWCSLTASAGHRRTEWRVSQCTYRCVMLPDDGRVGRRLHNVWVSMHLQVRDAP